MYKAKKGRAFMTDDTPPGQKKHIEKKQIRRK
jgi:hypothetical protein